MNFYCNGNWIIELKDRPTSVYVVMGISIFDMLDEAFKSLDEYSMGYYIQFLRYFRKINFLSPKILFAGMHI